MSLSPPAPQAPPRLARSLFDHAVAVAEVDPRSLDPDQVLLEVEREAVARAIDTRRMQYAAGRHCARAAMRSLDLEPGPVTQGSDRAPCFPTGLVGTITHTQWWCAAAVAPLGARVALGIDVEPATPLKPALFSSVLTPSEEAALAKVDEPLRGLLGKLIFSAKECAYKCQYTLSRTYYGFHGMRVDLPAGLGDLPSEGEYSAVFLRDAGPFRAGDALRGRFARDEGYLMTGMELQREPR